MARFRYVAKNIEGKTVRGTMEVAGENTLQQLLKEQGLYLIEAKDLAGKKEYSPVEAKDLALFCKELSTMLMSGISMVRAIEIIVGEEGISPKVKEVYQAVLSDLKRGISFSEALETKKAFPDLMIGMVRSGEGSGNLDKVTQRLAIHYDKENQLNQQIKSAMTYPMALLGMCVAVVVIMVTFILPQFEEMFAGMETLPTPTVILLKVADFITNQWYVAIILAVLLFTLFRILLRIRNVKRVIDYWKVHLPVVGALNKVTYSARFSRTISSLYSSGMPLVSALQTAGATIGNVYIEEQFGKVTTMVRSGVPLSKALMEVDGLVNKLSATIMIGEESGQLDTMLDSLAQKMEGEAEEATKRLVTLLQPILICIMAFIVGGIVVAIMLPIYSSYGTIEGAA